MFNLLNKMLWNRISDSKEFEDFNQDYNISFNRSFEEDQDGEYIVDKPDNISLKLVFSVLMNDTEWKKLTIGTILYHKIVSSEGNKCIRKVEIIGLLTRGKYPKQTIKCRY